MFWAKTIERSPPLSPTDLISLALLYDFLNTRLFDLQGSLYDPKRGSSTLQKSLIKTFKKRGDVLDVLRKHGMDDPAAAYAAAGAVCEVLRSHEPITLYLHFEAFIRSHGDPSSLQKVCSSLPAPMARALHELCGHLQKVVECSSSKKQERDLATAVAPGLFRRDESTAVTSREAEIRRGLVGELLEMPWLEPRSRTAVAYARGVPTVPQEAGRPAPQEAPRGRKTYARDTAPQEWEEDSDEDSFFATPPKRLSRSQSLPPPSQKTVQVSVAPTKKNMIQRAVRVQWSSDAPETEADLRHALGFAGPIVKAGLGRNGMGIVLFERAAAAQRAVRDYAGPWHLTEIVKNQPTNDEQPLLLESAEAHEERRRKHEAAKADKELNVKLRTLRVSWPQGRTPPGDDELEDDFSQFGEVANVGINHKRRSALILFADVASLLKAEKKYVGGLSLKRLASDLGDVKRSSPVIETTFDAVLPEDDVIETTYDVVLPEDDFWGSCTTSLKARTLYVSWPEHEPRPSPEAICHALNCDNEGTVLKCGFAKRNAALVQFVDERSATAAEARYRGLWEVIHYERHYEQQHLHLLLHDGSEAVADKSILLTMVEEGFMTFDEVVSALPFVVVAMDKRERTAVLLMTTRIDARAACDLIIAKRSTFSGVDAALIRPFLLGSPRKRKEASSPLKIMPAPQSPTEAAPPSPPPPSPVATRGTSTEEEEEEEEPALRPPSPASPSSVVEDSTEMWRKRAVEAEEALLKQQQQQHKQEEKLSAEAEAAEWWRRRALAAEDEVTRKDREPRPAPEPPLSARDIADILKSHAQTLGSEIRATIKDVVTPLVAPKEQRPSYEAQRAAYETQRALRGLGGDDSSRAAAAAAAAAESPRRQRPPCENYAPSPNKMRPASTAQDAFSQMIDVQSQVARRLETDLERLRTELEGIRGESRFSPKAASPYSSSTPYQFTKPAALYPPESTYRLAYEPPSSARTQRVASTPPAPYGGPPSSMTSLDFRPQHPALKEWWGQVAGHSSYTYAPHYSSHYDPGPRRSPYVPTS